MSPIARVKAGQGAGPWCSKCGRQVVDLSPSLDPRHPFGTCSYMIPGVGPSGHGRVVATRDVDELHAVLDARARERAWKRHEKHPFATSAVRGCAICRKAFADAQ